MRVVLRWPALSSERGAGREWEAARWCRCAKGGTAWVCVGQLRRGRGRSLADPPIGPEFATTCEMGDVRIKRVTLDRAVGDAAAMAGRSRRRPQRKARQKGAFDGLNGPQRVHLPMPTSPGVSPARNWHRAKSWKSRLWVEAERHFPPMTHL